MHIHVCTHVCEYIQSSDTLEALILIVQNIIPVQGISFNPLLACLSVPSHHYSLSDLCEREQCVFMLSVSSRKTHDMATICINFQMEDVKACSATGPVCLKSAKAL